MAVFWTWQESGEHVAGQCCNLIFDEELRPLHGMYGSTRAEDALSEVTNIGLENGQLNKKNLG